jgi:hypothetical protein
MKMRNTLLLLTFVAISSLLFYSCSKTDSSAKARMKVYLTDDPGNYQAVLIDIKDVKVNFSNDTASGWVSLPNVQAGTYDLLTLVNNKDTLLADAQIQTGRIQQIRLILGSENFVKVNDQIIKLETPSAQQSGLKINIHQEVTEGVLYKLTLDFDVAKSIHKTGNGRYMLKPVIRAMVEAAGGSIRGVVLPASEKTAVLAIQGVDTVASTYTGTNGGYIIKGINAGAYSLHFIPNNAALSKQIKDGITVTNNNVTVVDTVRLQ